jgi:hypothetical protein
MNRPAVFRGGTASAPPITRAARCSGETPAHRSPTASGGFTTSRTPTWPAGRCSRQSGRPSLADRTHARPTDRGRHRRRPSGFTPLSLNPAGWTMLTAPGANPTTQRVARSSRPPVATVCTATPNSSSATSHSGSNGGNPPLATTPWFTAASPTRQAEPRGCVAAG